jgi:hypothetical protein
LRVASIDHHQQPGLSIYGFQSGSGFELLFQFKHACCDAIGALQFIEDVLLAYAWAIDVRSNKKVYDDGPIAWYRIDPKHLRGRARFGLTRWQLLGKVRQQAVGLFGAWHFLTRISAQLASASSTASLAEESMSFPAAHTCELSATVTTSLLAKAREAGTTLNNLLIRDLLLAIGDLQNLRSRAYDRGWLRLSIPVNLRRPATRNLSAANVVGMVFVDRQKHDLSDQHSLLKGIHGQMKQIKDRELGMLFPLSLQFSKGLPGARKRMQRMSSDSRCRCTAVLSNVMRPFDTIPLPRRDGKLVVGDFELTGIEFLPPVRQGTPAAFGVLTYADRLNITLQYDPRILTPQEAEELLRGYVNYLLHSAGPQK